MIRFGTGGWRAIIADGFTKANLQLLTAGLCKLMEEEGHLGRQICVGYDRRFLSKESARWAAEVLAGNGFRVYMVNRSSPTPLIMFTVKQLELPYGMAITASHNPAIYNGVKVFTAGGRDADQQVTGRIEDCIASIQDRPVKTVDYDQAVASGLVEEGYPFNSYVDSILDMVQVNAIRQARLRIAIDPMYGVGQSSLRTILLTCRCDVDVIHEQHDTLFGVRMPAPSAIMIFLSVCDFITTFLRGAARADASILLHEPEIFAEFSEVEGLFGSEHLVHVDGRLLVLLPRGGTQRLHKGGKGAHVLRVGIFCGERLREKAAFFGEQRELPARVLRRRLLLLAQPVPLAGGADERLGDVGTFRLQLRKARGQGAVLLFERLGGALLLLQYGGILLPQPCDELFHVAF